MTFQIGQDSASINACMYVYLYVCIACLVMCSVMFTVFKDAFFSSESKINDCCMRLPGELNLWPKSTLIDDM